MVIEFNTFMYGFWGERTMAIRQQSLSLTTRQHRADLMNMLTEVQLDALFEDSSAYQYATGF